LFAEPGGVLWIGYLAGDIVRWESGRTISFGSKDGLKGGQWSSFVLGDHHEVWIANDTFFGRYENGKLTRLEQDLGDRLFIAPRRGGGLWIASNDRLCRLEGGKVSLVTDSPPWEGAARVRTLFEDVNGTLWIGTSSRGLFSFRNGQFQNVDTSHQSINVVRGDAEGNIWVATHGGGLNRLRTRIFRIYNTHDGLLDDISYSVGEDRSGHLWIGNCDGGLARLESQGIRAFGQPTNWPTLRVFSVAADSEQRVWIGTRTGLYLWDGDPRRVPMRMEESTLKDIHVLYSGTRGDVWVGADPEVLGRFRGTQFRSFGEADGFFGGNVRAVLEDKNGDVWIGTETGDVYRFHADRWQRFQRADGLPGSAIRAMSMDDDGVLWIATSGGGLMARVDGRFGRITTAQGLPGNSIYQLVLDDRDRMWFGSPAGVFYAARKELLDCVRGQATQVHAVWLSRSDGLSSVSCVGGYQPACCRTSRGQLWFATRQGLLEVNTAAEHINRGGPPVFIDECFVDDQPVSLDSDAPLKIAAGRRKLEFRFSVVSYTAPEKVQVRHWLDGFDSDWVEAGSERRVNYPKLPAGQYRLRIAACNNGGIWNEARAPLAFAVLPAWWQTGWFRATAIIGFAALVGLSVRYWSHRRLRLRLERLEQQQVLEKERARIARDLHDDLGVSLTQIALLAEMSSGDSLPVERLKKNSSQLARNARRLVRELDGILWTVNPKNDSLEKLAAYLCQFSQQFFRVTPICCRFDVAENIPPYPLSPEVRHDLFLVVKEAMNNVVKHSRATEVWLRLRVQDGTFEAVIEDNGCGFPESTLNQSERNGMHNMRQRAEGIGGRFEVHAHDAGTVVRIQFPLKSNQNSKHA
jgi:signal transduction histidine kinase/ligand-binding sensor domain-containing protein